MPLAFIGEIRLFAGNFPPRDWAFCNGQILSISQNTALFSIIGTTYGGNGVSTFALPNLQGRAPMQAGEGLGLTPRTRGQALGTETHTLTVLEMPAHTHSLGAQSGNGHSDSPFGAAMARSPAGIPQFAPSPDAIMAADALTTTGGGQPHNNMQPYLTLNFIICMSGVFPPRWE